jgi:DNA adenine methylase
MEEHEPTLTQRMLNELSASPMPVAVPADCPCKSSQGSCSVHKARRARRLFIHTVKVLLSMSTPIIPWMGGKRRLADRLIPLFHHTNAMSKSLPAVPRCISCGPRPRPLKS